MCFHLKRLGEKRTTEIYEKKRYKDWSNMSKIKRGKGKTKTKKKKKWNLKLIL